MTPIPRRRFIALCATHSLFGRVLLRGENTDLAFHSCAARLRKVYEAIESFRRTRGDYPLRLHDLCQFDYLANLNMQVCPDAERAGSLSSVAPGILTSTNSDNQATYEYELSNEVSMDPRDVAGLADQSRRGWKKHLLETALGKFVPILRCERHSKCINVTAQGKLYLSEQYWELEYVDVLPEIYSMPYLAQIRSPSILAYAAPRPSRLAAECLDLQQAANALPGDPWLEGISDGDSLADLSSSFRDGFNSEGLPTFDVRWIIQVSGNFGSFDSWIGRKTFGAPSYPKRSKAVCFKAGQNTKIHLLHACAYGGVEGEEAGKIAVQAPDGRTVCELSLVYGKNTAVWRGPDFKNEATDLTPVWQGSSGSSGWRARLFHTVLPVNAFAGGETMVELTLDANVKSFAGPFIAAITLS
jgi:hypothetical protein